MNPYPKTKPIRLYGRYRTRFRRDIHTRSGGLCETCGAWAPLVDSDGVFDVFTCGHLSHILSVGAGGSDTPDNVKWECYRCHIVDGHTKGNADCRECGYWTAQGVSFCHRCGKDIKR